MGDGGRGDRKWRYSDREIKAARLHDHRLEEYSRGESNVKKNNNVIDKKKEECFIASAVYGSSNAYEVNVLREYRDNVLMHSAVGRGLVRVYYYAAGEKTASFIKRRAGFLIPLIKSGLDRIVENYEGGKVRE